jgi:DNA polymerase (family 10)
MSNEELIERLEDAVELMELTEVNVFKINAYRKLIQSLESDSRQVQNLDREEICKLYSKGMAAVLNELLASGTFSELTELEKEVPTGVRSLLRINGIGPKKVRALWKDAGIESTAELKKFCQEGKVSQLKGFGDKIQHSILEGIAYLEQVEGRLLLHKADALADGMEMEWKTAGINSVYRTGQFRTNPETISSLDFLFPVSERKKVQKWSEENPDLELLPEKSGPMHLRFRHRTSGCMLSLFFSSEDNRDRISFSLETEQKHWLEARNAGKNLYQVWKKGLPADDIYRSLGTAGIPPALRNGSFEWEEGFEKRLPDLVQYRDVKGCLHNHSRWSDGKNSIREMADWCRKQGWTYFGIADHSRSAGYANGLSEDSVYSQWAEIDALNGEYRNEFRVLKGIECDILGDGSLDYPEEILAGFDYVVASVHSIMKMDIRTATSRLIKAIENPYTSILGHCSGRILLRRPGYPLDYDKVIDACIANGVAIELNAHPARLDMDFHHLQSALEKGAMISVNPDAHEDSGMAYTEYGIRMAMKAGASAEQVLNCLPLSGVLKYLNEKKKSNAIHG